MNHGHVQSSCGGPNINEADLPFLGWPGGGELPIKDVVGIIAHSPLSFA